VNEQDRQCAYKCNIQACSRNHFCRGRAISNTCSECVSVALLSNMQSARSVLLSVACLAVEYFSILSYKRHGFREGGGGIIEHEMCALIFCTNFV